MIKKQIKKICSFLSSVIKTFNKYHLFRVQFKKFTSETNHISSNPRFEIDWQKRYPCLEDNTENTEFDTHYIYHPAWAARAIAKINPKNHIDIGSTLSFCTMLSAFVPVSFYDFRPAEISLSNLSSDHIDLTCLSLEDNSVDSLSCMHVIEHIGLGRYGDPIDPNGDLKAISELKRVLAINGNLFIVVPVGKPIIRFNAHRIYSYYQIVDYFFPFKLKQFALVDDKGQFILDADPLYTSQQNYGCGCWWFCKE